MSAMGDLGDPQRAGVFCVGIDLGTSRSSISAADGRRGVVESYVGWPADMVARKVLKRDVLIGSEAIEHRLMLDLHRPLERGLIREGTARDAEAVAHLLGHLLAAVGVPARRARGETVRAVVGVPAEAMRRNKQQVRDALGGLVDAVMVVSEPFAVAYGLEALVNALVVDLGAGTADLCVMRGRYPAAEEQRSLIEAGDAIDARLLALLAERHPQAAFSLFQVRQWKERHSFVGETNGRVVVTAPVDGRPARLDITQLMREACESVVGPVAAAMRELLARVEPEFQERVRQKVILSGGTALIPGLAGAFERELEPLGGGRVRVVLDPLFVGANGGLAIAQDAPDEDWERLTG